MTGRAHDLPRFWDGRAVIWSGWEPLVGGFICPPPKPSCCKACGSLAKPVVNRGRVAQVGATHAAISAIDAKRELLPLGIKHRLKGPRAIYELTAFRCPDCRHDQIDDRDGHTWDLDESDYSEDGSWER